MSPKAASQRGSSGSASRWPGRLLPASLRRGLAASLCSPPVGALVGTVYRDQVPCYGLRFHVPSPPVAARTKAQLLFGIYEGSEIRFVQRWLRPELDVVELGSSLGVVSSHCARKMEAGRRLVCVEANPALLPVLRRNLEEHASRQEVAVVNRALDYEAGEVELHVGGDTTASRVDRSATAGGEGRSVRVPATTLSALLREHALDRYALVCDVEGAEAGIVDEDLDALRGCQQAIVELHETTRKGSRISVEQLAEGFRAAGLVVRARHGPVHVFERPAGGEARGPEGGPG